MNMNSKLTSIAVLLCITAFAMPSGAIGQSSVSVRVETRTFPSIFQAWGPAQNLNPGPNGQTSSLSATETSDQTEARHDLVWIGWGQIGLKGNNHYEGLTTDFTPDSVQKALAERNALLAINPHLVLLCEVRYYDAWNDYLPADDPGWLPGPDGTRAAENNNTLANSTVYFLNYSDPKFQDRVAEQCAALMKTGVFDGIMLDWWNKEAPGRVGLVQKIRSAIGDNALIIGNCNGHRPISTASYMNGMFMEGYGASFFSKWQTAASNLAWAQTNFQQPVITAFEGWYQNGRNDYASMRNVTTLSLVFSNGYVLFAAPNGTSHPGHLHDYYTFWNKTLGKPVGPPDDPNEPQSNGSYIRDFANGTALFNPPDNQPVTVHFSSPRYSAATGSMSTEFTVSQGDGDLFLFQKP